ncbi:MAG: malto-oligosyltrehalose trehalohydrolase [Bryobacteraceae bacterium]|nr:malto-oligosyltrehalose trehalohydrolase [Bryobacteraceae bacterium]
MPIGAEVVDGGVSFRVWAPLRESMEVVSSGKRYPLHGESDGYFSGTVSGLSAGSRYKYRLPSGEEFPDPASRYQPEGAHGPSEVVDSSVFAWTDSAWRGVPLERAVIYEMHVGTFTDEGTFAGAAKRLPHLRDLGITVIEVMPLAEFTGRFGWGYDGVSLFAPSHLYGSPDDVRRFVNEAHSHGMAVILDVVYNHFGPDGNYAGQYSRDYFSTKHKTDWGEAINFDGKNAGPVREFFIANAGYWVDEFHMDGLRLDATQNIYDDSEPHILAEVTTRVREAGGERTTLVVAENEPQHTRLVRPRAAGGFGADALWNDDFHHSAVVALTSHNDAYYTDYLGAPQEFISAMKYGYLYQGQWYKWQKQRRGSPAFDLEPTAFITFLENHDQVANSARGLRMIQQATPGMLKAMTALVLLGPGTPMLFQGQEFGSARPFLYFADMPGNLCELVRNGRQEFMRQWRSVGESEMLKCLSDPCTSQVFEDSRLDWTEAERNTSVLKLHTDLLRLRHTDPVLGCWRRGMFDGAVIGRDAFVLRAFSPTHGDRLMVVNMGRDLHLDPAPEPLLAPPEDCRWEVLFSTEDPEYGGCGSPVPEGDDNWRFSGHAALVLRAVAGPARVKA